MTFPSNPEIIAISFRNKAAGWKLLYGNQDKVNISFLII